MGPIGYRSCLCSSTIHRILSIFLKLSNTLIFIRIVYDEEILTASYDCAWNIVNSNWAKFILDQHSPFFFGFSIISSTIRYWKKTVKFGFKSRTFRIWFQEWIYFNIINILAGVTCFNFYTKTMKWNVLGWMDSITIYYSTKILILYIKFWRNAVDFIWRIIINLYQ